MIFLVPFRKIEQEHKCFEFFQEEIKMNFEKNNDNAINDILFFSNDTNDAITTNSKSSMVTSATLEDFLLDNGNWSPDDLTSSSSVQSNFNFVEQPPPQSHQSVSSSSSNYYMSDSESNLSSCIGTNITTATTTKDNESINFLNMINDHFNVNNIGCVTNETSIYHQQQQGSQQSNPSDSQIMMMDSCFDELS